MSFLDKIVVESSKNKEILYQAWCWSMDYDKVIDKVLLITSWIGMLIGFCFLIGILAGWVDVSQELTTKDILTLFGGLFTMACAIEYRCVCDRLNT